MSKCKQQQAEGRVMAQCITCLLSTLEDRSSDPQSPCKRRVGTVTLQWFKRQKGDFPEQAGDVSLQLALALVESPRLWIKGQGGIRRLWTSALGLHMHQHVHMCPYTAEHTHSHRLAHHAPTHTILSYTRFPATHQVHTYTTLTLLHTHTHSPTHTQHTHSYNTHTYHTRTHTTNYTH